MTGSNKNPRLGVLFTAAVLCCGGSAAAQIGTVPVTSGQMSHRTYLKSELAAKRDLPFSKGVRVGDTLYIAGATAVDPGTANKTLNAAEEARSVMNDVKQVVEQAGMTMDDVVSIQVFCTNLANYDTFNRVYRTYFKGHFPARAFIGVNQLLFGARYEVMGIAIKSHK